MADKAQVPVKKKLTAKPKAKPRRKGKKSMVTKIKPFVLPGGALLAFLAPYMKRAAGPDVTIVDLLKADLENFDAKEAMKRLTGAAGTIAIPAIAGVAIKETRILGKVSSIGADLLLGLAIGAAGKAILDPPNTMSKRGPENTRYIAARRNLYEGGY